MDPYAALPKARPVSFTYPETGMVEEVVNLMIEEHLERFRKKDVYLVLIYMKQPMVDLLQIKSPENWEIRLRQYSKPEVLRSPENFCHNKVLNEDCFFLYVTPPEYTGSTVKVVSNLEFDFGADWSQFEFELNLPDGPEGVWKIINYEEVLYDEEFYLD